MDDEYYNQKKKRDAEFITVPNTLKAKVGSGGLDDRIIERAQELLESHAQEFAPLADLYLSKMKKAIDNAKSSNLNNNDMESMINDILVPCVQLKANGAMFNYPLVTKIADKFAKFMEVIDRLDNQVLDIASAFHATIKIVISGKIEGDGGKQGKALLNELSSVCLRYFEKHKTSIEFD